MPTAGIAAQRTLPPTGGSRVHGAWNFLVDPDHPADQSPAIWRARDNPSVVILARRSWDALALEETEGELSTLIEQTSAAGQHLVLTANGIRHRLLVIPSTRLNGASYIVPADCAVTIRLAAIGAFHSASQPRSTAAMGTSLHPSDYQRHRLILLLAILDRVNDRREGPPTLRELGQQVVYPGMPAGSALEWKSSSHRRQIQRLVAEARCMAADGFRALLARQATTAKAFGSASGTEPRR